MKTTAEPYLGRAPSEKSRKALVSHCWYNFDHQCDDRGLERSALCPFKEMNDVVLHDTFV
jgi:hypothetical protein